MLIITLFYSFIASTITQESTISKLETACYHSFLPLIKQRNHLTTTYDAKGSLLYYLPTPVCSHSISQQTDGAHYIKMFNKSREAELLCTLEQPICYGKLYN